MSPVGFKIIKLEVIDIHISLLKNTLAYTRFVVMTHFGMNFVVSRKRYRIMSN